MGDPTAIPTTLIEAAGAIRAGETTSVQLTEHCLDVTKALDDMVGAFVTVTGESALAAAERADAELAAGTDRGPLHGIPFALKDILATSDSPSTANSRILDPAWGNGWDSVVTERVRDAGAVLTGKLVLSEFALGPPDPATGFPIPRNPWDLDRTAGGSSSGTGIAVATGMVLGGLGTDTGGSVRFPAAANGHSGLKVTYGRVPKWGCVPLGYSLDSIGPMARSAADCAAIFDVIAGHDPRDVTAAETATTPTLETVDLGVEGIRIGVPRAYFFDDDHVEAAVLDAVEGLLAVLQEAGAEVVDVDLPRAAEAKEANTLTMVCEAFAYHRMDLGSDRWAEYGSGTRRIIARGALYSAADYVQAQRFRRWFAGRAAAVMADVDLLVTPTWPTGAPVSAEMDLERRLLQPSFTGPFNLVGYPALAVPIGFDGNVMPVSAQIVGAPFAEDLVLRAGHAYQERTSWHRAVPPLVGQRLAGSPA